MIQPLGKSFSLLTKYYIGIVTQMLAELEIERYFYVISVLNESDNKLCQKELAEVLQVDNVTMVRIADYLTSKNYIKRVQSPNDRRAYQLSLMPKGLKALPKINAAFEKANEICFSGFNKTEQKEFQRLLLKMEENLNHHPRFEVKLNYKKIK